MRDFARTLFVVALLGAGCATPSRAEELVCPPIARMPIAGEPIPYGDGLLWKVEREGVAASYLFGTIHVGDPRVLDIPAPVESALRSGRLFVMEALFEPDAVARFAGSMYFADGTRLEDLAGRPLADRAQSLLLRFHVPAESARSLKPWAAFLTLNQPPADGGLPLDLLLMQRAREYGLPVEGLETLEEQAQVFGAFSDAEQVAMLRDTVCHFDLVQAQLRRLVEFYLRRDVAAIVRLTGEYAGSDLELAARMDRVLIDDRNARMVERLQPALRRGGAFVAVGALHLPGSGGILTLLEKRGYAVSRMH
ncbi:MAG: TraB/GumN family protein [Gammaproteobacteria bacterium]